MYNETYLDPIQLSSAIEIHSNKGYTLLTMVASDERHINGSYVVRYVLQAPKDYNEPKLLALCACLKSGSPALPSIAAHMPAANWYEREAQDLFGITFVGHPDPRPLVCHGAWDEGTYPLRKDYVQKEQPSRTADGGGYRVPPGGFSGAMEIPVGPIHAGIIEPGHFRFSALGDEVRSLDARLFYTHRGLEKAAEGLPPHEGLHLAERICGVCSVSHAVSYSQAIENAIDITLTRRARQTRSLLLELERLYNHIGDVGNICAGVGLAFGISQMGILKERLLRLNDALCGNRFLRGAVSIGGVNLDLDEKKVEMIKGEITSVMDRFREISDAIMDSDSFQDRITGTGILPAETAVVMGAVGVAARASGVDTDSRRDLPHAAYDELEFQVITDKTGDVAARIRVRIAEALESRRLVIDLLKHLDHGEITVDHQYQAGIGLGITESPRGSNVHWISLNKDGRIERYRVRSASYANWPVVPAAVPSNIVPDFPLINKSFELCYSCLDR